MAPFPTSPSAQMRPPCRRITLCTVAKSDPVPLKLVLRVQPLKRAEEIGGIGHIKPRAIVADEEDRLAIILPCAKLDARGGLLTRELPGIGQQVMKRDFQQLTVSLGSGAFHDGKLHFSIRFAVAQVLRYGGRKGAQIHAFPVNLVARQARQPKQTFDQLTHPPRRRLHTTKIIAPLRVEFFQVILHERLAEAVNGAQRRPEIVRNRIGECFQFLVRRLRAPRCAEPRPH